MRDPGRGLAPSCASRTSENAKLKRLVGLLPRELDEATREVLVVEG
ncbi:MAG: hypothetical protein R3A52_29460 [Polyangiales bacterium]